MSLLSRPHVPPLYAPGSAPTDTSAPWETSEGGTGEPFHFLTEDGSFLNTEAGLRLLQEEAP